MEAEGMTSKFRFVWLAFGGILMVFYNGNACAVIPWIAPLFILRFARTCTGREFLLVPVVLSLSHAVLLYVPFSNASIPPGLRVVLGMVCGLFVFMPYLADRLITKKIPGFASTLVFPAAWVTVEYLFSRVSPLATFGAIGYTQIGFLPFVQLASITGVWGLSFIVIWFSSAVNRVWESGFRFSEIWIGATIYAAVFLAVLAYGGFRLHDSLPVKTVRVAASSRLYDEDDMFRRALENGTCPGPGENIRVLDRFVEKTALPGAEVVFWHEYALITGEAEEQRIVNHTRLRAREMGTYLGLPLGVVKKQGEKHLIENKVIWIGPDGDVLSAYIKSFTAPWETSSNPVKKIPAFRIGEVVAGTAICFDMDFPWLIRQAGTSHISLMLVPSRDWRGISPFHSYMAAFRAVENGFSLVRPAGEKGVSIASDPYGRIVALLDNVSSPDRLMNAAVPVYDVRTVYSAIGDLFAWLCIAGVAAAFLVTLRRSGLA